MAKNEIQVDIKEVLRHTTMTIRIKGWWEHRMRLWIAIQLFKLASRVVGMPIKVEIDNGNRD